MRFVRPASSAPWLAMGLVVTLLVLPACQTPAQPRPWHDEFTGEHGVYVYASRQSGGYDVRFVVNEADADHLHMHVRSTRTPIHGDRAYFLIDGERATQPMQARSHTRTTRTGGPNVGVGVGRGVGPGVHTGVGMTFRQPAREAVYEATVQLPIDFVQQMLGAEEVRIRVGEPSGPSYTLSDTTRERLSGLVDPRPANASR